MCQRSKKIEARFVSGGSINLQDRPLAQKTRIGRNSKGRTITPHTFKMPPRDMTFQEQMDGFPWSQILVISLVRLAEPIAFTSLFTYVYFMVKDFGVAETKADVSKYAGFLASSFAFCQVLTSIFWGNFADKYGRKPTMIIGLSGSVASVLMFGFAKSYSGALLARCLMGLLNGNVTVVRTMLGEVATEKKHQALAFSVMPLVWQIGAVMGPMIGGYLSGRETSFSFMKDFVQKYPYARPNIIIAFLLFCSIIGAVFFLEETHYKHRFRRDPFLEIGDRFLVNRCGFGPRIRPWQDRFLQEEEESMIPMTDMSTGTSSDPEESESDTPFRGHKKAKSKTNIATHSVTDDEEDHATIKDLLTPPIFASIASNFMVSTHAVVVDEFLPVFLSTTLALNADGSLMSKFPFKIAGGLSYTPQDTGMLLSSTGIISIVFMLVALPWINRKYDTIPIYKAFNVVFPPLFICLPYVVFLGHHLKMANWVVYLLTSTRCLCLNILFPQLNMIVHVCAPPKHRAFVNGVAISFTSFARCAGPFLWGFIMSFGQSHDVAWIGWWALAALAVLSIYQSKNLVMLDDEDEELEGLRSPAGEEEQALRA